MDVKFPFIRVKLNNDQLKCINYDSKIHSDEKDLIIYEEVYHGETLRYCFSIKRDIEDLLSYNRNPYTGKLFSLDFINMIRERYGKATNGKLVETIDIIHENCIHCNTEEECKDHFREIKPLSLESVKFLDFYVSGTYMNDVKHFTIPNSIRTELSGIKLCTDYSKKLYRGVHFSLINIPYLYDHIKIKRYFNHEYIKPISTTVDINVAKNFATNNGIVIKFTKIKSSDILIDLNILPENLLSQLSSKDLILKEKEVILLPGVYNQEIIFRNKISDSELEFLNDLYNIFKDGIYKKDKNYLFKSYTIGHNIDKIEFQLENFSILLETEADKKKLSVSIDTDNKIDKTILFLGNGKDMIDYIKNNLDNIFSDVVHEYYDGKIKSKIKMRITYNNGIIVKKDGWFENGNKYFEETYKDEKLNGKKKYWYENGQQKYIYNYIDGKGHGLQEGWYENGNKHYKKNFIYGKYHGRQEMWYENGKKQYEKNYINGKLHGKQEEWYPNGENMYEENYINGKQNGRLQKWAKTGEIIIDTIVK